MYKKTKRTVKNGSLLIKHRVFMLVIFICVIVIGCAPRIYRLYGNSELPKMPGEIATLIGDSDNDIILYKVDGQYSPGDRAFGNNFVVELLPGHHTITVRCQLGPLISNEEVLQFDAVAGVTYAVVGPMDKRRPKNAGVIAILPENMWIDNKKN